MKFPGKEIASLIQKLIKKEVEKMKSKQKIKLVTFLIGKSEESLSFVKIKSQVAKKLNIDFELIHQKKTPFFEKFMRQIKEKSIDDKSTGIIIQQPLPSQLSTNSIYNYIDIEKEIEGHKNKSPFTPPIGLAVLTVLKYIYGKNTISRNLVVDIEKDRLFFKNVFRRKKIVLIGRGITGGEPIGKTLTNVKINYFAINSKTPSSEIYIREADVVITAVGKKVLYPEILKQGVVLINVGLRRENGKLKGDYDEKEIKDIASFYTTTPNGIGPIDSLYLYKNLLLAAKLQKIVKKYGKKAIRNYRSDRKWKN